MVHAFIHKAKSSLKFLAIPTLIAGGFIPSLGSTASADIATNGVVTLQDIQSQCAGSGSTLVGDVTYRAINDEDSGKFGYWALDSYNKEVLIYTESDGSYCLGALYRGTSLIPAGAHSPGTGTLETAQVSALMRGGWIITVPSSITVSDHLVSTVFNSNGLPTNGPLTRNTMLAAATETSATAPIKGSSADLGGTLGDVLLGTYANSQMGNAFAFNVISAYFGAAASSANWVNWGWSYTYDGQAWYDTQSGISGDIVV